MLAGYASTRLYKMFKLDNWTSNTLVTALFFPGIVFGIFFVLNLLVWADTSNGATSTGAVPFGSLVALLVLWLGISVPLVYLGSYFAFKKPAIEPPVKVNQIPRMLLPEQSWYTHPQLSILVGGVLPFGAVFIEIFFIMSSVWLHQFYYMFGFLFIVFVILIITCAEITIVMCYFQLCNEVRRASRPFVQCQLLLTCCWCRALCCSGLPLVVALVPDVGFVGAVPVPVLDPLLRDQARDRPVHARHALLRIHAPRLIHLLYPHRNVSTASPSTPTPRVPCTHPLVRAAVQDRVRCLLPVRAENLLVDQDRLSEWVSGVLHACKIVPARGSVKRQERVLR